jgi:hypothetical protein
MKRTTGKLTGRSESRYRNASQLSSAVALLAKCSAGIRVVGRRAGVMASPVCLEVATDDGLARNRKLLSIAIGDLPRESLGNAPVFNSREIRNRQREATAGRVNRSTTRDNLLSSKMVSDLAVRDG